MGDAPPMCGRERNNACDECDELGFCTWLRALDALPKGRRRRWTAKTQDESKGDT